MTPPLEAGVVAVVGDVPGAAWELAAGLADRSHQVVLVPFAPGPVEPPDSVEGLAVASPWAADSAGSLVDVLSAATAGMPPLRAAVWAHTVASATSPAPLASMSEEDWARTAEEPITQLRYFFQGVFGRLAGGAGSIVVVVPSSALTGGSSGFVPWTSASDGQRALVRVAARAWGGEGITVNAVAVTPDLLAGEPAAVAGRPRLRPGLKPLSIPSPAVRHEVASVVGSLIGPDWRGVTGMTIGVDGGVWMMP